MWVALYIFGQVIKFQELFWYPIMTWSCFGFDHTIFFISYSLVNEKLNKVKIVFCAMCFDRFRTNLLQKTLKLSAMILGSLVFNSSDAGDRMLWLCGSVPCLLMPWLFKSPGHQQVWYWQYGIIATCGVAPLEIWWSSYEQNPKYDMKCDYIFL